MFPAPDETCGAGDIDMLASWQSFCTYIRIPSHSPYYRSLLLLQFWISKIQNPRLWGILTDLNRQVSDMPRTLKL
jgi:hypothetical protein